MRRNDLGYRKSEKSGLAPHLGGAVLRNDAIRVRRAHVGRSQKTWQTPQLSTGRGNHRPSMWDESHSEESCLGIRTGGKHLLLLLHVMPREV